MQYIFRSARQLGAFKDSIAKVLATNLVKKNVTVGVDFMGGERRLEISYYDIKKI